MTTTSNAPADPMSVISQLLHHASITVTRQAAEAGPESPLHGLGLGVVLARGAAAALLPTDWDIDELEDEARSTVELLVAAENLSRSVPRREFSYVDLTIHLGDLISEARRLGC